MSGDGFTVDIESLHALQQEADTIRGRFKNVDSKDDFDGGQIGHGGLTDRLVSFAKGWRDGRNSINTQLDGLSKSLAQVVANYEQAEKANQESMTPNGSQGQSPSGNGKTGKGQPSPPSAGDKGASASPGSPPGAPAAGAVSGGMGVAGAAGAAAARIARGPAGGGASSVSSRIPTPPSDGKASGVGAGQGSTAAGSTLPPGARPFVDGALPGLPIAGPSFGEGGGVGAPFPPGPISLPDLSRQLVGVRDGIGAQITRLDADIARCTDPTLKADLARIRAGLVQQRDFLTRITQPSAQWYQGGANPTAMPSVQQLASPNFAAVVPAFNAAADPSARMTAGFAPNQASNGIAPSAAGSEPSTAPPITADTGNGDLASALPPPAEEALRNLEKAGVDPSAVHLIGDPSTSRAVADAVQRGRAGSGAALGQKTDGNSAGSSMLGMMIMSAVTMMARPSHRKSKVEVDG